MSGDVVPAALHDLLPVVQRWGAIASDGERHDVATFAELSDGRITELERWADSWTPEMHRAHDQWANRVDLAKSHERCKFHFLLMMLDELEIRFPVSGDRPDLVTRHIADLKVFDGIAARATRAWAARFLCDLEDDGKPAIEALRTATGDPEDEVKVWAHAALAIITRDPNPHRIAIQAFVAKGKNSEIIGIASALEEIDKTSEQRLVGRLRGAAITDDLAEIRKVIGRVDVDLLDHNGATAAEYAVGNGHPDALRLLLEAGAGANRRNRGNKTLLHEAACRRRGCLMIPMLLEHGADPALKDGEGRTALDLAVAYGRRRNVALLEGSRP